MSGSRFAPAVAPVPLSVEALYCFVACHSASRMLDFSSPVYGLISHAALPLSSTSQSESVPPRLGWAGSFGTSVDPSLSRIDELVPANGVVRIVWLSVRLGVVVLGSAPAVAAPAAGNAAPTRPTTNATRTPTERRPTRAIAFPPVQPPDCEVEPSH